MHSNRRSLAEQLRWNHEEWGTLHVRAIVLVAAVAAALWAVQAR
jgi:hypothetical protein